MAYTTYFPERNRYQDFLDAGYRIFFVNVSFTTLPINPITEFTPFRVGVFEDEGNSDYSEFEEYIRQILHACPDAITVINKETFREQIWNLPASDMLTSLDTIYEFTNQIGATLTVMEDGEHWFHTDAQMDVLDNWIGNSIL